MTPATARGLVRRVEPHPDPSADADLVGRFARTADPAAFAALVRRHGPMVLAACRRMLPTPADADDAFQAVFLVLLRKAGAVRPAGAVGGWLHGVAVRTAQKARVAAARRRRREMTRVLTSPEESSLSPAEHAELRAVLDEELAKLPEPQRAALVLCDLAGKTRAEAAADLGCPEGTVAARVHRARKALAERLTRRGVTAPAVVAAAAVPAELAAAVARFADGGPIPAAVRSLADGVVRGMAAHPLSLAVAALAAAAIAAGALWAAGPAPAEAVAAADPVPAAARPVVDLSFNADGTRYVVLAGGAAAVKDAATDQTLWTAPAEAVRFTRTPAGRDDLTTLTADGVVQRGGADGTPHGRTAPRPKTATPWRAVRFSADAARYAVHTGAGVRVYETTTGAEAVEPAEQHGPGDRPAAAHAADVLFSPDGKALVGLGVMIEPGNVGLAEWAMENGHRRRATGGDPRPTAAAYSPDSDMIAEGFADRIVLLSNKATEAPEPEGGRERTRLRPHKQLPPAAPVTALAFSPDGKVVAAGVRGGAGKLAAAVQLLDAATGKELRRFGGFAADAAVTALAFSPDSRTLLAGTAGGEVKRFAVADPPPASSHVSALQFAPDGKTYLVVASEKARVKDAATDRILWDAPAEAARFTADGTAVVTMGKDVERRSAATGEVQTAARRPKTELGWHAVAFSPEGARYAAHFGFEARVYDRDPAAEPFRLERSFGPPGGALIGVHGRDVRYSPDGKLLAAVGVMLTPTDMGTAVWDAETGKRLLAYPPPGNLGEWQGATAAAFSADGKRFAVALEKRVHVFDVPGFKHQLRLDDTPGSGPVTALAFAPDGKSLAVGYRLPLLHGGEVKPSVVGHKTEVQLIELATRKELRRFDGFGGVNHMGPTVLPVTALAFSPDGKTLLAGTGLSHLSTPPAGPIPPGEVKRFILADEPPAKGAAAPVWRETGKLPRFEDRVQSVTFSADGKQLAVGGRGGAAQHTVTMWDAATRRQLWAGGPVPAGTTGVSFSPDGKLLAATCDTTTGLYDARTGQPVPMNPPLPGGKAAAFSHAAERVAGQARRKLAVTDGRMVAVLDWAEGVPVSSATFGPLKDGPKVEGELPAGVAFAPSGRQLVFIPNHKVDPAFFAGKAAAAGPATHWVAHVWGGGSGEAMYPLPHGTAPVTAVAWSPDGKTIASGCRLGDVVVWDAKTFQELRRTRLGGRSGEGIIRALAFAPDGQTLAAAVSFDAGKNAERVVMLDPATGERRGNDLQGFGSFTPVALAFAPDGRPLAVGLADFLPQIQLPPGGEDRPLGSVVLFTTDPEPKEPPAAPAADDVSFAPDGRTYLFVHGGTVQLADAATDRVRWDAPADAARFTPDGKTVLTVGDGLIRRDAATGKVLTGLPRPKHSHPVRAAAFSPDGKRYAVHHGTFAQVLDGASGFELERLGPDPILPQRILPAGAVARVAWSADGKRLAVVGLPARADGKVGVLLWDAARPLSVELDGFPAAEARAAAFSPDGKTLAVATQHDVYLWADGAKAPRREALLGDLGAVGFLPDGRVLVAGEGRYADGKSDPPVYERRLFAHVIDRKQAFGGISAIDMTTVRPAGAPPVTALAVSPDGRSVLVAAGGGVTRLTFAEPPGR
ncbi:sigma-70 family RNA polymerase sigma factor [Urbifossiella limnaea]|uniref:ECF RNA polymerase sigma factor SigE n=1 Tax=Urbifossiella limnaea TaxID=2528023 RepID=A0A517Y2T9_9BACT|nr:sigma-70 family RNA polymerase sigma factor [Urbifossiella limnaea]QDU24065.1 ECF RNA polymerase sigma factor SigE [Urbifossiella limnaea]